ncbi:unnamed protein product [Victoria cruziana]
MKPENEQHEGFEHRKNQMANCYLHKFRLYETRSNFYMIGRDKNRISWRVLKIDRSDTSELNILEDSTTYTEDECQDLLKRIHEGNKATGGLKFVTNCYGIVGFIKFLGPYYMLIITKRRQIGAICGHTVYAITKSEMIALPHSIARANLTYSKYENSYSYHIMSSLQKNTCDYEAGQVLYETMFVWNEFLTRGIRNHLKSTIWTVALVYGFFKQAKLSVSGKDLKLTLIARRSRHYAGTRYLKRGVNEKGRVANDVETEQIVFEDVPEGCRTKISSVVQNRGSIPLFWSQETSRFNIRPDIVLLEKGNNYESTRLHFENLVKRYGNPIIVLNLIKTKEKKPRESILRTAFANAIDYINRDLPQENHLRFLHLDLHKHSKSKAENVLMMLRKVATYALDLTGFFYCQVTPPLQLERCLKQLSLQENDGQWPFESTQTKNLEHSQQFEPWNEEDSVGIRINNLTAEPMLQNGVLRTNCIDCLDRTNVAQYAYGLAALGQQLQALGLIDDPEIDLDDPVANTLMGFYERMGDILALQYGGSAAHNKIFSERRGQWKPATHSQELFRTLQRYYSNTYMDAEKQDAINVFLGHFQPQPDKPALWELDSDQHYNIGRHGQGFDFQKSRTFRRSLSDGNILSEERPLYPAKDVGTKKDVFCTVQKKSGNGLSDFTPEITSESQVSCARFVTTVARRQLFPDTNKDSYFNNDISEQSLGGILSSSNFVDIDWLSSSGNSCEDETYERSALIRSPVAGQSLENVETGVPAETISRSVKEKDATEIKQTLETRSSNIHEFSDSFVQWVIHGETLCNCT